MTATDQHPAPPAPPPAIPAGPDANDRSMTFNQWGRLVILLALFTLLTVKTGIWGLVVVLGIVLMVFLHELGHYIAAKRAGMKVTEFFIGFGPRIWSFHRGETEYGLKVVPAGAYVKIIGMHNMEEVDPADEGRTYRQARFRDRFMVVTAGPLMNLASALVLIWVVLALVGSPQGSITKAPDQSRWNIGEVYPGTGAAAAGLRDGDKITAVNGQKVVDFNDLPPLIEDKTGQTVQVTYLRDGVTATVPVALKDYVTADGSSACCLGVARHLTDLDKQRVNPLAAVPQSFGEMGTITVKSIGAFGGFFSPSGLKDFGGQVVNARSDDKAAAPSRPTSSGASRTGTSTRTSDAQGENRLISLVGVFQIGTDAASSGIAALLLLFMLLNISLGIINLVPLLPFDGGHASIAVYEKIQERRRHLAGRYFTDVNRLMPLTYVVVLILVSIFITTTYLDLANPLKLE